MKLIDRISLKLYAIVIGVLSILIALAVTEIIPVESLINPIVYLTDGGASRVKITLIVCGILMILVIKSLCFASKPKNESKEGIVLENASGKLIISKESLENMISSVAREIPGTEATTSKTLVDRDKNLKVYVTTVVSRDVFIKDVSTELQHKIKDAMKRAADLEVKEVNVKIKNITSKKLKGQPKKQIETADQETTSETNTETNDNINSSANEEESTKENETREE